MRIVAVILGVVFCVLGATMVVLFSVQWNEQSAPAIVLGVMILFIGGHGIMGVFGVKFLFCTGANFIARVSYLEDDFLRLRHIKMSKRPGNGSLENARNVLVKHCNGNVAVLSVMTYRRRYFFVFHLVEAIRVDLHTLEVAK